MTRNTCKLILILLVCAVPLVAAVVDAEPNGGPYGELYAAAAGDQGTQQPVSPDDSPLQGALKSPESGSHLAAQWVGEKSAEPAGAVGLARRKGRAGPSHPCPIFNGVGSWLWRALGCCSRWRPPDTSPGCAPQSEVPVSVLLQRGLPQASNNPAAGPAADEQARPERRAA